MALSEYSLQNVEEAISSETNFTSDLLRLIAKADPENRSILRSAFPRAVEAYERFVNPDLRPQSGEEDAG